MIFIRQQAFASVRLHAHTSFSGDRPAAPTSSTSHGPYQLHHVVRYQLLCGALTPVFQCNVHARSVGIRHTQETGPEYGSRQDAKAAPQFALLREVQDLCEEPVRAGLRLQVSPVAHDWRCDTPSAAPKLAHCYTAEDQKQTGVCVGMWRLPKHADTEEDRNHRHAIIDE